MNRSNQQRESEIATLIEINEKRKKDIEELRSQMVQIISNQKRIEGKKLIYTEDKKSSFENRKKIIAIIFSLLLIMILIISIFLTSLIL